MTKLPVMHAITNIYYHYHTVFFNGVAVNLQPLLHVWLAVATLDLNLRPIPLDNSIIVLNN